MSKLTQDEQGRYWELCAIAETEGFPRFQATAVKTHLQEHSGQRRALLHQASDEAFKGAVANLARRYPNAQRPDLIVEVIVRGVESADFGDAPDGCQVGGHAKCECDDGWVWWTGPEPLYEGLTPQQGDPTVVEYAAYCPHCSSEEQRQRRAKRGLVRPPRAEAPSDNARPLRERVVEAMSHEDAGVRRGATVLAKMLGMMEGD